MILLIVMILISMLYTPEVPVSVQMPYSRLHENFIWTLRTDGTYGVSDAFSIRTGENGQRIREDYIGPRNDLPLLEEKISSGGFYSYATPYFRQKDRRWSRLYYGDYTFGRTGCVPSALAMIFSGILGREILPTEIADYLYYDLALFNSPLGGSYGAPLTAVVRAAQHWQVQCQLVDEYEEFVQALREGKCVYLAVNYLPGVTHAYVCLGYYGGSTYVKDSDSPALSHYYDVKELWQNRSDSRHDRIGDAVAAALWGN